MSILWVEWGKIALSLQWYMFQVDPTILTLSVDWGSKRDAKNMQHPFCQELIENVSSRTSLCLQELKADI